MTHDFGQLAKNLNAMPNKFKTNAVREFRKMVINTSSSIIIGTAVDTGKLRGNWQSSIESPILSAIDRLDPSGHEAKAEVGTVSRSISFFNMKFWLCNNLPYINRINTGWSKKSAIGFIEAAVEGGNRQFADINLLQ